MTDLAALKTANAKRWDEAKLTRSSQFDPVAARLVAAKARYQAVAAKTGVPWFVIAVIHERESSQNWAASLAQGDAWNKASVHVPAGRGPFQSWEEAAVDALVDCPPRAARWTDWSAGGALTLLEQYNGLAYANAGRPSPYVWSGTTVYDPPTGPGGKVVRDHGPIEAVTDKQLGCAGLLFVMMALDSSISFDVPHVAKPLPSAAQPSISNPAKGSIGAFIASILSSIFKRKA